MATNGVQFDEPGMGYGRAPQGPRTSALTKMIIKLGLAKDEKQAPMVMLIVAGLAVVLTVMFWPGSGTNDLPPAPTPVVQGR